MMLGLGWVYFLTLGILLVALIVVWLVIKKKQSQ